MGASHAKQAAGSTKCDSLIQGQSPINLPVVCEKELPPLDVGNHENKTFLTFTYNCHSNFEMEYKYDQVPVLRMISIQEEDEVKGKPSGGGGKGKMICDCKPAPEEERAHIVYDNVKYFVESVDLHIPSSHTFDGKQYPRAANHTQTGSPRDPRGAGDLHGCGSMSNAT